jgi:ADP-ribose pyrophosphatase YjhB (NUDIX family)
MPRKYTLTEKIAIVGYQLYSPLLQPYWRIFKPYTYGTRLLIYHPDKKDEVLLIRHTYGNTVDWNMPGGGYNTKKEMVEVAARREAKEEVGLCVGDIKLLAEFKSAHEGKRDTVAIFAGTATDLNIVLESEIAEARWFSLYEIPRLKTALVLQFLLKELALTTT